MTRESSDVKVVRGNAWLSAAGSSAEAWIFDDAGGLPALLIVGTVEEAARQIVNNMSDGGEGDVGAVKRRNQVAAALHRMIGDETT